MAEKQTASLAFYCSGQLLQIVVVYHYFNFCKLSFRVTFLQIVILDCFVNFANCCSKAIVMARGVHQTIYVAIFKIFYFLEIGVLTIFFGKLLLRKTFLCANYSCEYYFVKCLSSHPFLQNVHLDNFFLQSGVDHCFTMFAICCSRQTYTNFATCHSIQYTIRL